MTAKSAYMTSLHAIQPAFRKRTRVGDPNRRFLAADTQRPVDQARHPGTRRHPRAAMERQRQPARLLHSRHGAGRHPGERRRVLHLHRHRPGRCTTSSPARCTTSRTSREKSGAHPGAAHRTPPALLAARQLQRHDRRGPREHLRPARRRVRRLRPVPRHARSCAVRPADIPSTAGRPNARLFDAEGQHPPLSYAYGMPNWPARSTGRPSKTSRCTRCRSRKTGCANRTGTRSRPRWATSPRDMPGCASWIPTAHSTNTC